MRRAKSSAVWFHAANRVDAAPPSRSASARSPSTRTSASESPQCPPLRPAALRLRPRRDRGRRRRGSRRRRDLDQRPRSRRVRAPRSVMAVRAPWRRRAPPRRPRAAARPRARPSREAWHERVDRRRGAALADDAETCLRKTSDDARPRSHEPVDVLVALEHADEERGRPVRKWLAGRSAKSERSMKVGNTASGSRPRVCGRARRCTTRAPARRRRGARRSGRARRRAASRAAAFRSRTGASSGASRRAPRRSPEAVVLLRAARPISASVAVRGSSATIACGRKARIACRMRTGAARRTGRHPPWPLGA